MSNFSRVGVLDTSRPADASLSARPAGGLRSVAPEDWDRLLAPGNGALSHAFLAAWEHSELSGLRSRPVLAFEDGSPEPVAACPGYFYDLDVVGTRLPAAGRPLTAVRRLWPRLLTIKAYELGSPTPLTNPFLVSETLPREQGVMALVEAAMAEADRARARFVLIQNLTSLSGPAPQMLLPFGFAGVPIFPTAVVDLPYSSFDEYLGAMRAQYRRRANQTFRRSKDLKAEHLRDFGHLADELAQQWRLIYDRAKEVRREILTPSFFRAASDIEDTSVLLLRRPDGSIASFGLLLDDHPWLSFLQCGF
ncbi:MAG TPA: hypothetical protein VFH58_01910, partial [Acidimicrobiales bacterium]|nr:hypothetical protein [Acidimicrobiales bacterium]